MPNIKSCEHTVPRPNGICSQCGTVICRIELEYGCYCAVGWPYEKQCVECKDVKNRIDQLFCVCVPVKLPDRSLA